jgi:hypothetical protein
MYDVLRPMATLMALGLVASAVSAHKPDEARPNDRLTAQVEVQPRDDGFVIASTPQSDMAAGPVAAVQLGANTRIDTAILLESQAMAKAAPREARP